MSDPVPPERHVPAAMFGPLATVSPSAVVGSVTPFDWDGVGVHHWSFLVEHDLVFFFRDFRLGRGVATVSVGDGFPLEADFFVLHRHRLGGVLGDHVFSQPDRAGLASLGAHVEPFLRHRHRLVGGRA